MRWSGHAYLLVISASIWGACGVPPLAPLSHDPGVGGLDPVEDGVAPDGDAGCPGARDPDPPGCQDERPPGGGDGDEDCGELGDCAADDPDAEGGCGEGCGCDDCGCDDCGCDDCGCGDCGCDPGGDHDCDEGDGDCADECPGDCAPPPSPPAPLCPDDDDLC
jgi:hypothetical protein